MTADDTDSDATGLELTRRGALTVAGMGIGLGGLMTGVASAAPADKVSAAGSTLELIETTQSNGGKRDSASEVTLLSGTMKTSKPTDLVLQVSAECALFTDVKTKGNGGSRAVAGVTAWVEVDGEEVPVTAGSSGRVVLTNRDFEMKTSDFENEEATIELFLRTRSSHSFNWLTLNVGSGEHTVELKASLDVMADGSGSAKALVGPRTMIVTPTKLANDATI